MPLQRLTVLAVFALNAISGHGKTTGTRPWPGDLICRTTSLAALQSLQIALLTQDSAALVLEG